MRKYHVPIGWPDRDPRHYRFPIPNSVWAYQIKPTGLRHTFATLAIQNGVDAKTVSRILGHHSAGFALDTYAHVTGEMQKDAAQRMGSFMAQAM